MISRYSATGSRSRAVYYHNSFHNQIEYEYNSIDFTSQYVNFNHSFAHGAEVELRGQIVNSLSMTASVHLHLDPDPEGAAVRSAGRLRSADLWRGRAAAAPAQASRHGAAHLHQGRWGASLGAVAMGRRPDSDFLFGYIPPIYYAAGYARVDLGGWY